VALKIIKLGMDTRQVIARFEAERQALALLDHPNIARVFDAGATDTGRPYFVMELVRGGSITEYCNQNRLDTRRRLELFIQVCHAAQHAHQKGIIHRDLKPSNVMVTMHDDKPVPKVIDFGIAKATNQRLTEKTLFTRNAQMIGTPAYMSPEQAQTSGLDVDTRADIYSLGVLLYELLTGTTLFELSTLQGAGYAEIERIIRETDPPKPSTRLRSRHGNLAEMARGQRASGEALSKLIKGDLDLIVMKCLEKDRTRRYETTHALAEDIDRHLRHEPILARSPSIVYRLQKFTRRHRVRIAAALIGVMLLAGLITAVAMYRRAANLQWAKGEALPRMVEFVEEGDYRAAFSLARKAHKYIPEDPTLEELWPRLSKDFSITTTPAGAKISYRDYDAMDEPWQYLGQSPLATVILPKGMYRWKVEKEGFATHECVVDDSFAIQLQEKSPQCEMVWIDAFATEIPIDDYGQTTRVQVPAYLVDRYEVTNEQFKAFVDAGGYENPEYWQGPEFVRSGRELDWKEAIAAFHDSSGQFGPSTWHEGTYPQGQGKHPVSGVSWFEAVAYSKFAGKNLPTLYHWEHAACLGESIVIVPHSNFATDGTARVGSHPGMGHTGLYDMAGNVKEWSVNAADDSGSRRYILGGGWGEQTYMFAERDFRSPWDRAPANGFRCAKYPGGEESVTDALLRPLARRPVRDYSTVVPLSDKEFEIYKGPYEYDRTALNAVVESVDDNSAFWRREKITFDAAYGDERMIAYLFLPRGGKSPYQTVVYFPGGGATWQRSFEGLPQSDFTEFIIRSGRALLYPVYKGTYERPCAPGLETSFASFARAPMAHRDWIIQMSKDLSRSIDYVETREDLDDERIAYYGFSWGALLAPTMLATEKRIRTAVLAVGGFVAVEWPPNADPAVFAARVKAPVLMVNGKEDFFFPLRTSQIPMYELLGTAEEDKRHTVYPGGHGLFGLFGRQIRGDVLGWLDRYLVPHFRNSSTM